MAGRGRGKGGLFPQAGSRQPLVATFGHVHFARRMGADVVRHARRHQCLRRTRNPLPQRMGARRRRDNSLVGQQHRLRLPGKGQEHVHPFRRQLIQIRRAKGVLPPIDLRKHDADGGRRRGKHLVRAARFHLPLGHGARRTTLCADVARGRTNGAAGGEGPSFRRLQPGIIRVRLRRKRGASLPRGSRNLQSVREPGRRDVDRHAHGRTLPDEGMGDAARALFRRRNAGHHRQADTRVRGRRRRQHLVWHVQRPANVRRAAKMLRPGGSPGLCGRLEPSVDILFVQRQQRGDMAGQLLRGSKLLRPEARRHGALRLPEPHRQSALLLAGRQHGTGQGRQPVAGHRRRGNLLFGPELEPAGAIHVRDAPLFAAQQCERHRV